MRYSFAARTRLKGIAMPVAITYSLLFLIITYTIIDGTGLFLNNMEQLQKQKSILDNVDKIENLILDSLLVTNERNLEYTFVSPDKDSIAISVEDWGAFTYSRIKPYSDASLGKSFISCRKVNKGSGLIETMENIAVSGSPVLKGELYYNGRFTISRNESLHSSTDISGVDIKKTDQSSKSPPEFEIKPLNCTKVYVSDKIVMDHERSFNETALKLYSDGPLILSGCKLRGKIIVHSDNTIKVSTNCQLEDVILIGKEVFLEKGLKGRVQCIATEKVLIEENVQLAFPSAIVVSGNKPGRIVINKGTDMSGLVFAGHFPKAGQNEETGSCGITSHPFILIKEKAKISGQIICKGILINEGIIEGAFTSLTTGSLINTEFNLNSLSSGVFNADTETFLLTERYNVFDKKGKHVIARRLS